MLPDLPSHVASEVDVAIDAWQRGERYEAIRRLSDLAGSNPASPQVHGLAGAYLWEAGRPEEAVPFLECAVGLAPRWAQGSLWLFHTLHDAGDRKAAAGELTRFLELEPSEEHAKLLEAIQGREPAA